MVGTVVNVRAGLAVTVEAIWAGVAGEASEGRWLVVAVNSRIARAVRTAVCIHTGGPISTVPSVAGAAVHALSVVVAQCVGIAVVAFRIVAREDFGTSATGEGVSVVAGTVIRVGTRITAGTDRQHGRTFGSSCAVAPNVAVATRNSGVAADARITQACTIAAGYVVPVETS